MSQPSKVLVQGNCAALIYDPSEIVILDDAWLDEVCVKFYSNGEYLSAADYFTPDMDDAIGTAELELQRMSERT